MLRTVPKKQGEWPARRSFGDGSLREHVPIRFGFFMYDNLRFPLPILPFDHSNKHILQRGLDSLDLKIIQLR